MSDRVYPIYLWGPTKAGYRRTVQQHPRRGMLIACNLCLEEAGWLGSRSLREFARQPENYYWRLRWMRSGRIHHNTFCK